MVTFCSGTCAEYLASISECSAAYLQCLSVCVCICARMCACVCTSETVGQKGLHGYRLNPDLDLIQCTFIVGHPHIAVCVCKHMLMHMCLFNYVFVNILVKA